MSSSQSGTSQHGTTAAVSHDHGQHQQQPPGGGTVDGSNLIVNYLPPSFNENDLHTLFAPYGEITHVKVVYKKETAESLTYGFVKFQRNEDALSAIHSLNGLEIYGKKIKVSFARPSDPEIKNSKIFITRLPRSYSTEDIHRLFAECGEIIECRLLVDSEGQSRQLAFVQFATHADAETAIKRFSGVTPSGGEQSLVIKYAIQPKGLPPSGQHETLPSQAPDHIRSKPHRSVRPHVPLTTAPPQPVAIQWLPQSHPSLSSVSYWASSHHPPDASCYGATPLALSYPTNSAYPPSSSSISPSFASVHSLLAPLSYPTYLTLSVAPVPSSLDILSFPFLREYGQVIEGKLESLVSHTATTSSPSAPSDPSSGSCSSSHDFTQSHQQAALQYLPPGHPLPTHKLVYQIRVESYERALNLFRLHGTTFQLNGYYMSVEVQIQ